MTGIDEVILCDNKAKNVVIAIATARLFNEVSVQKNELKRLGYFITIPKVTKMNKMLPAIYIKSVLCRIIRKKEV